MIIKLGSTYTDKITGFRGIATGRCEYISGCNQGLIVPKVGEDGTMREGQWFDEQRLICDEAKAAVTLENGLTPGCDRPAPKR